jgi:DNA polymerase-3 subunit delta
MSSPAAQRTLRAAIQNKTFDPVYLLHGDDDFLKEDAVRQLVEAAVDPATRDFNLEFRRGGELSGETLGSLLATPPMMAERRVLVIRDPGALKKDARVALERYLSAPASDAVVLLVAPAGGKVDKLLLDRTTVLEFAPLTGDRVPKWITYHVQTTLQASITPAAVTLLEAAVGNDLPQLAMELEKLASYSGGREIDEDAVAAVVGVRKEETVGAYLDAVAARDTKLACTMVPGMLQQSKSSAVSIIALSTQMLAIGYARALRDRGMPPNRIAPEMFNLLKQTGAFPGRPWGEAVSCWTKAVATDRWPAADIDAALAALLTADRAAKESRVSSDEQLITSLTLAMCGVPARRTRAA